MTLRVVLLLGLSYFGMTQASIQTVNPTGPNVTLLGTSANSQGIQAKVQLQRVNTLTATVEVYDTGTGQFNPFISVSDVNIPSGLRNTGNNSSGTLQIPVVASDAQTTYRLTLESPDPASASGKATSNQTTFKGYEPPSLKAVDLTFNADSLRVSAKTDTVMTLTASWSLPSGQKGTQSLKQQNPQVDLSYADLTASKTASSLPAINVKLADDSGNVQESLITPAVAVPQNGSRKVQQAQNQPNKSTFSWSDLGGGIVTLLKFFAK